MNGAVPASDPPATIGRLAPLSVGDRPIFRQSGTLDDTDDGHLLSELFDSLRARVLEAGLDPPPRLPAGK
jgi:hypothetical protein